VPKESIWLEFPTLQPVVDQLAAEAGDPPFVAHMTLVGTVPDDAGQDSPSLEAAAAAVTGPHDVRFPTFGTRYEEKRYFCLVAEAEPALMRLFAAVAEQLPGNATESFAAWPHVSLVYGTPEVRRRWPDPMQLSERFAELVPGPHRSSAVARWDTEGPVSSWRRLESRDLPT
jgi:hypothetical protein